MTRWNKKEYVVTLSNGEKIGIWLTDNQLQDYRERASCIGATIERVKGGEG